MPRRIIWDRSGVNPIPYVSRVLGMDPYRCSDALHTLKQSAGLKPRDDTIIYDNGDVADKRSGDEIGNLLHEN